MDARRSVIVLTPTGRKKALDALLCVEREDREFFGSLKKDESAFINNMLRLMENNGTALD
jgi:DNA-binding MarR family transcriptional regulator